MSQQIHVSVDSTCCFQEHYKQRLKQNNNNNKKKSEKEMFTIMKLHEACTMPMLLYGIEGLIPTKMERKNLDDININIMRRIINTPPPPPPQQHPKNLS